MEYDSEDGLNHTLFRQYTPFQGYWETPDPKRGNVNFPSVDGPSGPQGQNLYAYVRDNPTNLTDPLGDEATNSSADGPSGPQPLMTTPLFPRS